MIYEVKGKLASGQELKRRLMAQSDAEARKMADALGITAPEVKQVEDAETAKLLLQEASEWARHYSTVRMTVTTFLITLSAGILAFNWGERFFIFLAAMVWLVAGGFFLAFTIPEWRELNWRSKHLGTIRGEHSEDYVELEPGLSMLEVFEKLAPVRYGKDAGITALIILSIAFVIGAIGSCYNLGPKDKAAPAPGGQGQNAGEGSVATQPAGAAEGTGTAER